MEKSNVFRLGMVLGYRSINAINDSLIEFCKYTLVYYNNEYKTKQDILEYIKNEYSLTFTVEELNVALDYEVNNFIYRGDKLCLTDEQFACVSEKYKQLYEKDKLSEIIKRYLHENDLDDKMHSDILVGVKNRIYDAFNKSYQQIASILNCDYHSLPNDLEEDELLTEKINNFLNWNDREKNECIFTLVSLAYDYCKINAKASDDILKHFEKISFIIDCNLVIRLMGINGEERKEVIRQFIELCNKNKVKLAYSNYTKFELETVIDNHVERIKGLLQNSSKPLNPGSLRPYIDSDSLYEFYTIYYNWYKNGRYHTNNLRDFKDYLWRKCKEILNEFDKNVEHVFAGEINDKIKDLGNALFQYKTQKRSFGENPESSTIDVQNIYVVLEERKRCETTYLISTDQKLINWAHGAFKGYDSIVDLPDVWMSLMMRLGNRTDDDCYAFNQFLNKRIPKVEWNIKNKDEILSLIMNADCEVELKDAILEDIKSNYEGRYSKIEDAREIVATAQESTMAKMKDEVKKETTILVQEQYEQKRNDDIKKIANIVQNNMEYNEKLISKKFEKNKIMDDVTQESKNIVKKNKKLLIGFFIFFSVLVVVFMIFIWDKIIHDIKWFSDTLVNILAVISAPGVIFYIMVGILKKLNVLEFETNVDVVKERLLKKHEEDLNRIDTEIKEYKSKIIEFDNL